MWVEGPETPCLTLVGAGTKRPCPDEMGCRLLSGEPVPAPPLLLTPRGFSPVKVSRRASVYMFTATLRNALSAPDLDVWGTAAWTGRDTGYLDLQMRHYLLEELLGSLLAWDLAHSPLPAPDKESQTQGCKVGHKNREEMLAQLAYQSASQTPARAPTSSLFLLLCFLSGVL